MLEVAAGGGYRVSPCVLQRRLRLCGPIHTALSRAAAAVLMFGLTWRVAPWPWALVPVVVLLALDHWPIEPEPHPSWPAIVACLASLELVARHYRSGKLRWLGLAGALAGVSF